ncbi:hypothetical protein BMR10_16805 [Methylococcaceae bacterium CS4]|nr:hypothetical protein BMR10_16805 [Methylococcaceae bacterium CS4]
MLSPAITGASAVAAPGGCKQRNNSITRIEPPTATAEAEAVSGILSAQLIPINAEHNCPPINGQGWAKGLLGIKNKITADAPIEATIIGELETPIVAWVIRAIKNIAQKQASKERIFAFIFN